MTVHEGSCHCGAIRITIEDGPVEATECNCSICRRIAALWHYAPPAKVTVTGAGVSYIQGDRMLETWHCQTCGCTTHWTAIEPTSERMGINLRLFDPALWQDLPRRLVDGASF